ncbi:sugar phosphate isomerase/epimerase [Candidatus Calescamantes bacterium]|nr:sugar phosphate isomerase/epimerase [Candidatus Calescamantes bacterium]
MKIGVKDNFIPLPLKESLALFREWGIRGVELSLNKEEFKPDALSQSGRRELREKFHTCGLEICALEYNLGGDWYLQTLAMEKKIEEITQAIKLGKDLFVSLIALTDDGRVGIGEENRTLLLKFFEEVGYLGDREGMILALDISASSPLELHQFIKELKRESMKLIFNPARWKIISTQSIGEIIHLWEDSLVHVYIIDGEIKEKSLEEEKSEERINSWKPFFEEKTLGEGELGVVKLVEVLAEIDYRGFCVLMTLQENLSLEEARKRVEFFKKVRRL